MIVIRKGDRVEVLEADGFVRMKGRIVEVKNIIEKTKQYTDLILDSGSSVRVILSE